MKQYELKRIIQFVTTACFVVFGEKRSWVFPVSGKSSHFYSYDLVIKDLALTNFKHLCAACWACSLGRWSTILHGDGFSILHLPLGAALHTIRLHLITSFR